MLPTPPVPQLEPQVSACERVSVHRPWVSHSLPSHPEGQNPHCCSQPYVVGLLFPALELQAVEASAGLGTLTHSGGTSAAEIALLVLIHHRQV